MPVYETEQVELTPPKRRPSWQLLLMHFPWLMLLALALRLIGMLSEQMNAPWIGV